VAYRRTLADVKAHPCEACGATIFSWWALCRSCYERNRSLRAQLSEFQRDQLGRKGQDGQGGADGSGPEVA
jgi:hypothetical protein